MLHEGEHLYFWDLLTADRLNKRVHLIGIGGQHRLRTLMVAVLGGMRRKGGRREN